MYSSSTGGLLLSNKRKNCWHVDQLFVCQKLGHVCVCVCWYVNVCVPRPYMLMHPTYKHFNFNMSCKRQTFSFFVLKVKRYSPRCQAWAISYQNLYSLAQKLGCYPASETERTWVLKEVQMIQNSRTGQMAEYMFCMHSLKTGKVRWAVWGIQGGCHPRCIYGSIITSYICKAHFTDERDQNCSI